MTPPAEDLAVRQRLHELRDLLQQRLALTKRAQTLVQQIAALEGAAEKTSRRDERP
jgi:hypothetical protein